MFRKITETEKQLRKLSKLRSIRETLIPRTRKKIFSKYSLKNDISLENLKYIKKIDDEIEELSTKLGLK